MKRCLVYIKDGFESAFRAALPQGYEIASKGIGKFTIHGEGLPGICETPKGEKCPIMDWRITSSGELVLLWESSGLDHAYGLKPCKKQLEKWQEDMVLQFTDAIREARSCSVDVQWRHQDFTTEFAYRPYILNQSGPGLITIRINY